MSSYVWKISKGDGISVSFLWNEDYEYDFDSQYFYSTELVKILIYSPSLSSSSLYFVSCSKYDHGIFIIDQFRGL